MLDGHVENAQRTEVCCACRFARPLPGDCLHGEPGPRRKTRGEFPTSCGDVGQASRDGGAGSAGLGRDEMARAIPPMLHVAPIQAMTGQELLLGLSDRAPPAGRDLTMRSEGFGPWRPPVRLNFRAGCDHAQPP